MKQTKKIVQLANGKYVKDWQYSQGHFDVVETTDVLEAAEMDEENFMVFFLEDGHKLATATYEISVKVDDAKNEQLKNRIRLARARQKEEGKKLGENKAIYDYL